MGAISYRPLILSIKVATIATNNALLTGTFLAHTLALRQFLDKTIFKALFLLPLVFPPTVGGFVLTFTV